MIEELSDPNHQGNFVVDYRLADLVDPTVAWHVMPVHPKIALLFLRGMTVLAAAKLVQEMFEHVPEDAEEQMMGLVDFIRVAVPQWRRRDRQPGWSGRWSTKNSQIRFSNGAEAS